MGWKTIEIQNSERLALFLDNLIIYKDDTKIKIPIADLDVLIIDNYKLNLTVQIINALADNNVLVIICDNQHLPKTNILPIIGNYNTLKIMQQQINWTKEFKAVIWQQLIKAKIKNQIEFLNYLDLAAADELILFYDNVLEYDINNREGHASKVYWHNLFGIDFKRHNDDYINSLLNYGYTILRSYMTRAIIKKGLDPRISIFHKSYHNYFALASDLMEVFRIIVDVVVFRIINSDTKLEFYLAKEMIIKEFNLRKILIDNKLQYINNAIDLFIDALINNQTILEVSYSYEQLQEPV